MIIFKNIKQLNAYQTREQAGFRSGFVSNDRLYVLKSVIAKTAEYNKPQALIFVHYKKAFDRINQYEMKAVSGRRIDNSFIIFIKYMITLRQRSGSKTMQTNFQYTESENNSKTSDPKY